MGLSFRIFQVALYLENLYQSPHSHKVDAPNLFSKNQE